MRALLRKRPANRVTPALVVAALTVLLVPANDNSLIAQPIAQPALDRASGVRFMLFRGAFGEICQAQFGNVALHFDVSEVVAPAGPAQDDEAFAAAESGPRKRVNLVQGSADEFVYGIDANAAAVRTRLEQTLRRRVAAIDKLCSLTEAQRSKLRLAGSGDIQRHLGRASLLRQKFEACPELTDINQFQNWCRQLSQEARTLDRAVNCGIFGNESLLAKTMRSTLTADQLKELQDDQGALIASGESNAAVAANCWETLGLKLEKLDTDAAGPLAAFRNKYRGGMRIVDVRSKGAAGDFGMRSGDILVGLHHWETVRWEDVKFILDQTAVLNGADGIKFFVVRGQDVLYGNLRLAARPK